MQKVYYVNGWPNNGFGYKIFWRWVKRYDTGDLIFVLKTIPLEEFIQTRRAVIASTADLLSSSPFVQDVRNKQEYELYIAENFLAGKYGEPSLRF